MRILRNTFLCFFCCLYGLVSFAQDDVSKELNDYKTANIDQKVTILHHIYMSIDRDSLLFYIKDLQQEGIVNHRDDALAMANFGMGFYLQGNSLFLESENKLKKAIAYYKRVGNDTMVSGTYNMLGNTAFLEGNISKAEILYHKSAESARLSGEKKFEMLSVFNLGKIYIQQGKNKEAEKNIRTYIQFLKKTHGNLASLANAYGSLGQLHMNQEDYEKAIHDYNNSMEFGLMVGSSKAVANGYTNLGIVEYLSGNNERSEQYFRLALAYRVKNKNKFDIAEGYYNLGNFFWGIDKNDSAIVNYEKSASVAKSTKNFKTEVDALDQLGNAYGYLGQKDKEIEVLRKIIKLQNKIKLQQSNDVLTALGLSYNQSMDEAKNLSLIREEKLQGQLGKYQSIFNTWMVVALLGILALIGLVIYLRRRNKSPMEKG